jgi:hypothetical protein
MMCFGLIFENPSVAFILKSLRNFLKVKSQLRSFLLYVYPLDSGSVTVITLSNHHHHHHHHHSIFTAFDLQSNFINLFLNSRVKSFQFCCYRSTYLIMSHCASILKAFLLSNNSIFGPHLSKSPVISDSRYQTRVFSCGHGNQLKNEREVQ